MVAQVWNYQWGTLLRGQHTLEKRGFRGFEVD